MIPDMRYILSIKDYPSMIKEVIKRQNVAIDTIKISQNIIKLVDIKIAVFVADNFR